MASCSRCGGGLPESATFCPTCGNQVRVPTVEGEVVDARSVRTRPPTPWVAAALSIVPGLGHVYAGAPLRGLAFFAGVVAPEVIGAEMDLSVILDPIGIPLGLGGIGLWAYSAVDAYRTARRRGFKAVS